MQVKPLIFKFIFIGLTYIVRFDVLTDVLYS